VVIRPYEWVDFPLPIDSSDAEARRVTLAEPASYPLVPGGYGAPASYHVENVRAAIDRPGEWSHDHKTGRLYYRPPAGLDPTEARVVAGRLNVIVALDGAADEDKWVQHVTLRGLTFRHSGREDRWRHYEGTALRLNHGVRDCRVLECRFLDTGASGVVLWKEVVDCTVARCEFARNGDTCLKVFDYLGEGPAMSGGHRIVNNHFHHGGTVRRHMAAIGVSGSEGCRIAHNLIHHMPYNGIHLTGARAEYWSAKAVPELEPPYTAAKIKPHVRTRKNVIEHNHIHHVMRELYDGGAIYCWGTMGEGTNRVRNNLIHHVGQGEGISVGIYLDDACDDVVVEDNVVVGARIGQHLHGAPRNRIQNNFFTYCTRSDITIQPEEYNIAPMGTEVVRNIFAWGKGKVFDTGEGWNKNWDRKPIRAMKHNLYWRGGEQVELGTGHLKGFDSQSDVARPAFDPAKARRHILAPGKAAQRLGIRPIDLRRVGLTEPLPWMDALPPREPLILPLPAEQLRDLPGWGEDAEPDRD
jgi:hypothetical protein